MNGDRPRLGWIVWLAAATAACAALWTVLTYRPTPDQVSEARDESDLAARRIATAVAGGEREIRRLLTRGSFDAARDNAGMWAKQESESVEAAYWASYLYGQTPEGQEVAARFTRRGLHLSAEAIEQDPEEPTWQAYRGWFERLSGDPESARASFERAVTLLQARGPDAQSSADWAYDMACYLTLAGRIDEGIEHLHMAIEAGWTRVNWLRVDPDLDALREHDGYAALLVRIDEIRFIAESAPVESPSVSDINRAAEREAARQRAGAGAK